MKWMFTVMVVLSLLLFAGCGNQAKTGALLGGAGGAAVGQIAGRDTESTLIGSGIGAGIGYLLGNEADKKQTNIQSASQQVTINVQNSNGSITPVTLTRTQYGWVGPRGEFYSKLPTAEELKSYGW